MDDIIEIVLSIVLDGAIDIINSKKVPMPIRIVVAVVVSAFILGILGLLLAVAVKAGSIVLTLLFITIFIVLAILIIRTIKQRKTD